VVTPVAYALSDDWDSCLQDQTSEGDTPEIEENGYQVWNAEWDLCEDCDNLGPPAGTHSLTIEVDPGSGPNCPSVTLQPVLAQLFVQFCAPMGLLSANTNIGTVSWFKGVNFITTTTLYYSYTVGGDDPYSVAYSEVTCNAAYITESNLPTKMFVQWNSVGGSDSPAKGNAPRGWELHLTCCDV
jgi:hypothetical protein